MIKIVTDSTCDLPPEVFRQHDITVKPLSIHFGTETFLDGVTISKDEFFQRLRTAPRLPTTSQPSAGDFCETFRPLVEAGHEVMGVFISSELSGTCASAHAACGLLPEAPVTVFDSHSTSAGLGWMVLEAARMAEAGASGAAIRERLEDMSAKMRVYFVVDTLEYLQKGGRIGGAKALLGTMLRIKPLLMLQEGRVEALEQVRTRRKALQRMIELISDGIRQYRTVSLAVLHAQAEAEAKAVREQVLAALPCKESFSVEIGPTLGTHAGPGVIGIAAYGD
jgi:DegV family protein with EDD domain